jgi:transcriptional regulator GlxA family with amidase domain
MKLPRSAFLSCVALFCAACSSQSTSASASSGAVCAAPSASLMIPGFDPSLPTVGVVVFNDVLMTEVTAPFDVFSKLDKDGKKRFNVITVAESSEVVITETGLKLAPDRNFSACPKLEVLVIPGSYGFAELIKNQALVEFIKSKNGEAKFTMSNCAGAYLVGASKIAVGRKIVTYVGGGKDLQEKYPDLLVQDDSKVSWVMNGNFISSNGNLASYISALELLEKMTSREHRKFAESYLYLEQLSDWSKNQH